MEASAPAPMDSEALLAAAWPLTRPVLWDLDLRTGWLTWSAEVCEMLGLPVGEARTVQEWDSWVHPDDRAAVQAAQVDGLRTGQGWTVPFRVAPPGRAERHLRVWCDPMAGPDGRPAHVIGAVVDVTDQRLDIAALEAGREELRLAFDDAPIAMVMLSALPGRPHRLVRRNRAAFAMFGRPVDATLPTAADGESAWFGDDSLIAEASVPAARQFLAALLAAPVPSASSTQLVLVTVGGAAMDAWVHASSAHGNSPGEVIVLLHFLDITQQTLAERQLAALALTDPVTGAGNRSRFQQSLDEWLPDVVPGRRAVAILLLDLDRFKLVNDSLGHPTGDLLLAEVALRLRAFADPSWLICRLGGDEFAILVVDAPDEAELGRIARRLGDVLAAPYTLPGDVSIVCTASIGISRCDDPTSQTQDLYREADLALYAAKDTGRDTWAVFDGLLKQRADRWIATERRLRTALGRDGVRMYLQPVVDLATGRTVAAEALARLEHPDAGLLDPAEFIQLAEDTGLVVTIDARITELALAHLAHPGTPPDLAIAVNLSARSLDHAVYLERLAAALNERGVDRSRLMVEVTESSLLDPSGRRAQGLAEIRRAGLAIGIDDFGTGYSALAYLDRFCLDFLKIDRSFVARLGTSPQADAVVAAIVALAHAHGLVVTAEGVESAEQAARLREMGCDRAQGHWFGRPAPVR